MAAFYAYRRFNSKKLTLNVGAVSITMSNYSDIAILGGGLAGMTLALQLRARLPEVSITILERLQYPVPEAAHKVGESTVEIGAHYLSKIIGLEEHLQNKQLRKYGLRLFFDAGTVTDLAQAGELGASHLLSVPAYQIDRGILENHLAERVQAEGITLRAGATVLDVQLSEDNTEHHVSFRAQDTRHSISARWVVDAMSRGSVIKRRLGLAEDNGHQCSSVWFRIQDRIDISDWSNDPQWQQRCNQLPRWLSTNHLMGQGYWVWLIPLSSGSTSIGIVFDDALHDFKQLKTYNGTLAWLALHQPLCYQAIKRSSGALQDFRYLHHFSHGCRQVYSAQRWALSGESGVFLDPFYSPGTDFIAISNTFVTDLIERDFAGEAMARRARVYQHYYLSFYQSSLNLYYNQYPLFGHTRAMSAKTIWDYAYYWGILAVLFFSQRLTDTDLMARHVAMLDELRQIHAQIQKMFLQWSIEEPAMDTTGLFINQSELPLLVRLSRELTEVTADPELADERLIGNGAMLRTLAANLCALAPASAAACVTLLETQDTTTTASGTENLLIGLPSRFRSPQHSLSPS